MKAAVTILPSAWSYLNQLFEGEPGRVLRVYLSSKGCSGNSYEYEWLPENELGRYDDVQTLSGGKFAIRADSVLNLLGSELDYEATPFSQGLVWKNPLVKNTCGCGKSVGF